MSPNSVFKSANGREAIRTYYNQILGFFPYTQRNLESPWGNIFVLEAGDHQNPALILLHGSCSNSAAWLGDVPALAEKFHVFAVDIPGEAGNSEEYRLDFHSDEYSRWLAKLLDLLGLNRAAIAGNSLGGYLALQFAAAFPQRVEALILLAPSGIVPPRQSFLDQTANIAEDTDQAATAKDAVLADSHIPKEVREFMDLILANFIPYTGALPVLTDEQMENLTMPVLFIAGTQDITMDVAKARERLCRLVPNAQTHLIENGSHIITEAASLILPFLLEERVNDGNP